jgi:SAM-dependent methyltransferase
MKRLTAEYRIKAVGRYATMGRWLDLGAANGALVRAAREKGFDAEGIDLSSVAVESGKAEGVRLHVSTIEEWDPPYRYSMITGFDILEHVPDPLDFVRHVCRLLEPGGVAALAVPNTHSIFSRLMGKNWWFYIPEEHLTYFHPKTIEGIYRKVGLAPIHTGRISKPLTLTYGLTQFQEYNPLIYKAMKGASYVLPRALMDAIIPFYIGEMIAVARREPNR